MTQIDPAIEADFQQAAQGLILENMHKHPDDWKTGGLPATEAQVSAIRTATSGGVGDPSIIPSLMAWDATRESGQMQVGTLTKGEASLWMSQHLPGLT